MTNHPMIRSHTGAMVPYRDGMKLRFCNPYHPEDNCDFTATRLVGEVNGECIIWARTIL